MNDVSEGSLALLLLVETTLVDRPTENPTIRRAGRLLMRGGRLLADLLIIIELALLLLDVALIFCDLPPDDEHRLDLVNGAMENVTLAFTFIYRFGLLSMTRKRGLEQLLHDEWLELLFHIIFATHEYPFMVLENVTGAPWEYVQGLYMRLTLSPCI